MRSDAENGALTQHLAVERPGGPGILWFLGRTISIFYSAGSGGIGG